MSYVLQCKECKRPADIKETKLVNYKSGKLKHKIYKKDCDCGGKIVVELE